MNDVTRKRITSVEKSTRNYLSASNPAQLQAHRTFLVQRAGELEPRRVELGMWLEKADRWINANMPEINTDETHERNTIWLERLHEYEAISTVLNAAFDALFPEKEAA